MKLSMFKRNSRFRIIDKVDLFFGHMSQYSHFNNIRNRNLKRLHQVSTTKKILNENSENFTLHECKSDHQELFQYVINTSSRMGDYRLPLMVKKNKLEVNKYEI